VHSLKLSPNLRQPPPSEESQVLAKTKSTNIGGSAGPSLSSSASLFRVASNNKQSNLTIPGKDDGEDEHANSKKNGT
jgi:hypothetical protein